MQGYLSEIDIRSILQLLELGQRTGELYVEAYGPSPAAIATAPAIAADRAALGDDPSRSWLVFLVNGQIVYAGTTDGTLDRLRDYLHRYQLDSALDTTTVSSIASINSPEYGYLWTLLENHVLSPEQCRTILNNLVQETLFDLLSLHQGSFTFQLGSALNPQLISFEIGPLVTTTTKQIQEWKQLHPHIYSPQQRPIVPDPTALSHLMSEGTYERLCGWMDGHTSIRQLARYLNRDMVTVARSLYPYLKRGLVHLMPAAYDPKPDDTLEAWQATRVPRVVCIDDGATVRQTVETILDGQGYEVTSLGNPLKALSLLFQLKPDLILCDIVMPELEGYELCAMLRQSSTFRQTPIIMLTGKVGFIDRVKARMAGATDYLTKPFGAGELLTLVEKYVGPGNPQRPRPDHLLAEAIEDEFDLDIPRPRPARQMG